MPDSIIAPFQREYAQPIETYRQVNNITQRDAIPANRRWEGMQVYVLSDSTTYELRGGTNNTFWRSSVGFNDTVVEFQGYYNVGSNSPALQDSNGILGHEYIVTNAGAGLNKDFGSGNILLKNTDVIIFDGAKWSKKVNNNQSQDLSAYQQTSEKGAANGYAPLNGSAVIDPVYLPSYVDDVLEFANLGSFPATGETGKIYIALDTEFQYRWSGSAYVQLKSGNFQLKKTIASNAGTAYTIAPSDADKVTLFTNAGNVTVTVDTGSLSNIGETAEIDYQGSGTLTIAAGTATLKQNPNRLLESDGQYSRIAIQKINATDYRVFGELGIL